VRIRVRNYPRPNRPKEPTVYQYKNYYSYGHGLRTNYVISMRKMSAQGNMMWV